MTTVSSRILDLFSSTYKSKVNNLRKNLSTELDGTLNALLDPAYNVKGDWEMSAGTFREKVNDPLEYASCYPTAETLFPILTGSDQPAAHGNNLDTYPNGDQLRTQVEALISRMQQDIAAGTETVYRVEFAGHGFTLISTKTSDDNFAFEVIESLAHFSSLVDSLRRNPYTPEEIYANLRGMGSDDIGERRHAADKMLWNADRLYLGADPDKDGRIDFPRVRMKWWSGALHAAWLDNWMGIVRQRYNFLAGFHGMRKWN